jgi:arginase
MVAGGPPVRLLQVPYDSGAYNARMGPGRWRWPARQRSGCAAAGTPWRRWRLSLCPAGAPSCGRRSSCTTLLRAPSPPDAVLLRAPSPPDAVRASCRCCCGQLQRHPGSARRDGPPGTAAGAGVAGCPRRLQHSDLDPSGFLDGQGLAMVAGRCWQAVTSAGCSAKPWTLRARRSSAADLSWPWPGSRQAPCSAC